MRRALAGVAVLAAAAGVTAPAAAADPAPVITGVDPPQGVFGGGDRVTIHGDNFTSDAKVRFVWKIANTPEYDRQADPVGSTAYVDAHTLEVWSPEDIKLYNIYVKISPQVTVDEIAGTDAAALFQYSGTTDGPQPTIFATDTNGAKALPAGGYTIELHGQGFSNGRNVTVTVTPMNYQGKTLDCGGTCPGVSHLKTISDNAITFTMPAEPSTADSVNIKVTTNGGTSDPTGFHFDNPPPHIISMTPDSGSPDGGTHVTLLGSGFKNGPATVSLVTILAGDGHPLANCGQQINCPGPQNVNIVSDSEIDFDMPKDPVIHLESSPRTPQWGQHVTVTNAVGASDNFKDFHYCNSASAGSDIPGLLNTIFAVSDCSAEPGGLITWLLQQPDVTGWLSQTSLDQPAPNRTDQQSHVQQLEDLTAGISLGLFGLLLSVSVLRFSLVGVSTGDPGALVRGLLESVGAVLLIVAWPDIFVIGQKTADVVTRALVGGDQSLDGAAMILMASMLLLAAGVAFFGAVGLIIAILFVIAGTALFVWMISEKLGLYVIETVDYVALPLAAILSRFPGFDFALPACIRAWAVAMVWPIAWALLLKSAVAIGLDTISVDSAGSIVANVAKPIVSVIVLIGCVKMPKMLWTVAMNGTALQGTAGRGGGFSIPRMVASQVLSGTVGANVVNKIGPALANANAGLRRGALPTWLAGDPAQWARKTQGAGDPGNRVPTGPTSPLPRGMAGHSSALAKQLNAQWTDNGQHGHVVQYDNGSGAGPQPTEVTPDMVAQSLANLGTLVNPDGTPRHVPKILSDHFRHSANFSADGKPTVRPASAELASEYQLAQHPARAQIARDFGIVASASKTAFDLGEKQHSSKPLRPQYDFSWRAA
jgi:hypothetical protein